MGKVALAALAAALAVVASANGGGTSATTIPGCGIDSLNLLEPGVLTVGTDNPAFPPWFGGAARAPWKVSDPRSGKGYESAVAYAIARELGFARSAVAWAYVPFARSYRPGNKPFDFYLAQVSYTPQRERVVDFSKSYYFVNQAVVGVRGRPITTVRTIAGLRNFRLAAQLGTTSYDYIVKHIRPSRSPLAYDTNDLAVQALKNGQIDGIVVDLPTAFYVTAVQVTNGKIVGQLPTRGAKERFGLVFEQGNALRTCVNRALDRLWRRGTIKALQRQWLARVAGAPELK